MQVSCSKSVKLKGGFYYTVRSARDDYVCFFCNRIIPRGGIYVEERFASVVRRYHYECINKTVNRIRAVEAPSGIVLCVD